MQVGKPNKANAKLTRIGCKVEATTTMSMSDEEAMSMLKQANE